jgi:uncharacterized membrane protein YedE/YeeE
MKMLLGALISGLIFGTGLVISGMTQPTKVLGFLDVFGAWDPTLAFVMGGALAVSLPGFYFARGRSRPLFAAHFRWPMKSEIDAPLIRGAMLFGLGWGLVGLCPGPAIVNLATFLPQIVVFIAMMGVGIYALDWWRGWQRS